MKKILSSALALVLVFTLSLTAFAADITKAEAQEIALRDAGYSASDVLFLKSKIDRDDGRTEYDVEFSVKNSDGSYTDYDYEISSSGRVLSRDKDIERVNTLEDRFELLFRQIFEWLLSFFR